MKRLFAFALVLILALSFTACGADDDKSEIIHSIKVKNALCERLNISSYPNPIEDITQDISCSKTVSGINCTVTKSIAFGYDIIAVVEITPKKRQLEVDYPNGLTVSEMEVLSNGEPVSSDLAVVSDLIFFDEENISTVFIHVSSDSPDFSIGDTITLNIKGISPIGSDESLDIKKLFDLSWTLTDVDSPSVMNLKSDKICGSVAITAMSIHLELTESPYSSAEELFEEVVIDPFDIDQCSFFVSENLSNPDFKFIVSDSNGVQRCSAVFPQCYYEMTDKKRLFYIGQTDFLV